MILLNKPGVYQGVPMVEYLKAPAVSGGMLVDLETRCPKAAWFGSWLNPEFRPDMSTKAQNAGSIAHQIFLEGKNDCCVIVDPAEHPNEKGGGIPVGWTNKAIKLARDTILAEGKIPVLKGDYAEIEAMVRAMQRFVMGLKESEPAIYAALQPDGGESEVTVVWDDDGTLCRVRPDRISKDRSLMIDVKTTLASAEPRGWGRRQVFPLGFDMGAAFYERGGMAAFKVAPTYVWLVVEQDPPYLCSLVSLAPDARAIAKSKVAAALDDWACCARDNIFPSYPNRVVYVEAPPWMLAEHEAADTTPSRDEAAVHAYFEKTGTAPL